MRKCSEILYQILLKTSAMENNLSKMTGSMALITPYFLYSLEFSFICKRGVLNKQWNKRDG